MICLTLSCGTRSLRVVEIAGDADDHLAIAAHLELLFHLHLLLNKNGLLVGAAQLLLLYILELLLCFCTGTDDFGLYRLLALPGTWGWPGIPFGETVIPVFDYISYCASYEDVPVKF